MQLQMQFIIYFLPASSGFHFHTHTFRSLLHICIAQTTAVSDVTPARAASRILYSSGAVWCQQPSTAHKSAPAPDKIGRRGGKSEIMWAHTYPTVSSRYTGVMCAKFGSDRFKNVDLYKVQTNIQTNKQTNIHLYI
jgi:hypothetical protein